MKNKLRRTCKLTIFFALNPHRFLFFIADFSLLMFDYLLLLAEWMSERADSARDRLADWKDRTPLFAKGIAASLIEDYRQEYQAQRAEASRKAAEAIMPKRDNGINQ